MAYGSNARRFNNDRKTGLSQHPYEVAPGVCSYSGGFFAHLEWPVKTVLEKHASLRALAEYEANYTNASGYRLAFAETALALRAEKLAKPDNVGAADAERYDVWAVLGIRFGLHVVGLRTEFFRIYAKDPNPPD